MFFIQSEFCLSIDFTEIDTDKTPLDFKVFLERKQLPGVIETVPAFDSLSIYVDYRVINVSGHIFIQSVAQLIEEFKNLPDNYNELNQEIVRIPVCYDDFYFLDKNRVLSYTGLGKEEFVQKHSSETYRVKMLGFIPGFPYMGNIPDGLQVPRLERARSFVPEGSVGIAGIQTGIYPASVPGGWNIIGRTPLKIIDLDKSFPFLLSPNDLVNFSPITKEEFMDTNEYVI